MAMIGAGQIVGLFEDDNYRRIWTTGMASGICRWLEMLAVGVYAFETTGSPFLVALLVILRLLPLVFFGSVVGTFADRLSPRRFLVTGMALGMLASGSVSLLLFLDLGGYWVVAAGAFIGGVVWTLDMPLRRRMIGDLAGKERLVTALSFDSATNHSTRALGPLFGGILYATFGASGAFALTASLYLIGLLSISRVEDGRASGGAPVEPATRALADFRESFALVARDRDILRILLVTIVFNVWALPFLSMIPVIGSERLHLGAGWIGALAALEGLGAFFGGLAIAIFNPGIGMRRMYFFGVFFFLVFAFIAGWMTSPVAFAFFVLLLGISGSGFSAMQSTLAYSVAPPNMRSRLFGLIVLCIGTGLFGVLNIGFVAEWFDGATSVRIVAVEGLIALVAIGIGWRQLWDRPVL
jgi:MFS family permease